jgi:predicted acetyltransferase
VLDYPRRVTADYLNAPIDRASAESLATQGLTLAVVDTADRAAFEAWLHAEARGFHGGRDSAEIIDLQLDGLAYRRTTGVWDPASPDTAAPVATLSSWIGPVTVPGHRSVDAWAVSGVTVAPTHRRRGIARALLESELRTAHSLGVPLAMLTVSEATIYARYGFAPAVMAADWTIDTRRAVWTGPTTHGRLHFLTAEQARTDLEALLEEVRLDNPGQVQSWSLQLDRIAGLVGDDKEHIKKLRAIRYDDVAGRPRGIAFYAVSEKNDEYFRFSLDVEMLVASTDDAYAALWRFLLEQDLVSTVTAKLRSSTEAVAWQISDFRAARVTAQRDHLWTRILDVKASLEARAYSAHGSIVLEVTDPLGFAEGRFLLEIADDGSASVEPLLSDAPENAAVIALGVNELGALYLGGVSAVTLTRAGRITELREGSASAVDASFRSPITPWLSLWF